MKGVTQPYHPLSALQQPPAESGANPEEVDRKFLQPRNVHPAAPNPSVTAASPRLAPQGQHPYHPQSRHVGAIQENAQTHQNPQNRNAFTYYTTAGPNHSNAASMNVIPRGYNQQPKPLPIYQQRQNVPSKTTVYHHHPNNVITITQHGPGVPTNRTFVQYGPAPAIPPQQMGQNNVTTVAPPACNRHRSVSMVGGPGNHQGANMKPSAPKVQSYKQEHVSHSILQGTQGNELALQQNNNVVVLPQKRDAQKAGMELEANQKTDSKRQSLPKKGGNKHSPFDLRDMPAYNRYHSVPLVGGPGNHQGANMKPSAPKVQSYKQEHVSHSILQGTQGNELAPQQNNNVVVLPQKRGAQKAGMELEANQKMDSNRQSLPKKDGKKHSSFDLRDMPKGSVTVLDRISSQCSDRTDRGESPVAEMEATTSIAHPDAVISADDGTMWACSKCRSATFLSYDECVRHEETCTSEVDEMRKELEILRETNKHLEERNTKLAEQNKYLLRANIKMKKKLEMMD